MQPSGLAARLATLQRAYAHTVGGAAAAMMAATVVVTCVQVFYRYFLGTSLIWAEELCRYLLIWTTFVAVGLAFQRGDLASMELVIQRAPRWARLALLVPAYLASVAFLVGLVYYGAIYATGNRNQAIPAADFIWQALAGRDSGITIFWIYVAVPFGAALLAVHFALSTVRLLLPPPAANAAGGLPGA